MSSVIFLFVGGSTVLGFGGTKGHLGKAAGGGLLGGGLIPGGGGNIGVGAASVDSGPG